MMRSLLAAAGLTAVSLLTACDRPPRHRPVERPVMLAEVTTARDAVATVLGQVRQAQRATLGFDMAGRLASVAVHPGDSFAQGQVLAALDPAPARLRLAQARSEALAARGEWLDEVEQLRRQTALFHDGAASQSALARTRAAEQAAHGKADAADAAVELAQRDVDHSRILAPFPGRVVTRMAEPGGDLAAGQTVLAVEGEDQFDVVASVPATLASALAVGDTAQLVSSDGVRTAVRLSHLSAHMDRGATVEGIFHVSPAPHGLLPGQWVELQISNMSAGESGVAIPLTALMPQAQAGSASVFVFDPVHGQVLRRSVTVTATRGDCVVIGTGLSLGEQVVKAGTAYLTDGEAVVTWEGVSAGEHP